MKAYKIAIVDDHEIFRNGLKLLLNKIEDVNVVVEASNGIEFLELVEKYKDDIDIVFMDINMPLLDGIDTTEEIKKNYPEIKIIALTTFGDNEYFDKMIYAGAEGYMLKNSDINDFKKAIDKISHGGNYFSEEILVNFTRNIVSKKIEKKEKSNVPELTKREIEVLGLICKGYSNDKIGEKLFISSKTVERHKRNIILKTDTHNTLNLVIYAFKTGLAKL